MRALRWIVCVLLVCASQIRADELLLKNGNVIKGDIISEDSEKVVINIKLGKDRDGRIEMTFDRAKIMRIRREAGLFQTRPTIIAGESKKGARAAAAEATEALPVTEATPETEGGEEGGTTEAPAAPANPLDEMDPMLRMQIEAQLRNLSSTNDDTRNEAEMRITAFGKEATPLLVELVKTTDSRRAKISVCKALRATGDKRAVRILIDQLQGGKDDTTRMKYAWLALKGITGQALPFDEDSSQRKRSADRQKWVDWFKTVEETYPPQLGYEEEKKPETEAATETTEG